MSTSSGAVVLAMSRNAEKRIVQTLRGHGATAGDRAVPLALTRPMDRAILRRLLRSGSVRQDGERYWLVESGYATMRDRRRVHAVIALVVVAVVITAILAMAAFGQS